MRKPTRPLARRIDERQPAPYQQRSPEPVFCTEYGVATIPFPIPHDQYAHCMELLEALEIGDTVKADCKVDEIDRALLRGGITDSADARLRLEDSHLPNEVDVLLDMEYETFSDLNELAAATDGLSNADMEKLGAVVMLAKPENAAQIKNLAENLDLFDFAPGTHTPEEYGKYMIRQSGHFDYDENLDAFYDYEKYGTERMNEEDGMFTDRGYIAYKDYYSMEEVMNGGQSNRMVMGGMM